MHDGGHKSYSSIRWVNGLMAFSSDCLGGSSFFWNSKHNRLHHTYANISGHDSDIELGVLGRLSPEQPHLPHHRFQHLYMWFLYGFLVMKWALYDDFISLKTGRIGQQKVAVPKGKDLMLLYLGKAIYLSWTLIIPAMLLPLWSVIAIYFAASFIEGFILAVVFQLAHCLEEAAFPVPNSQTARIGEEWYVHQLQTTVNFSMKNRLLGWYVGGLNCQIEHHLFPKISHVHYPKIAKIVESVCRKHRIPYKSHPTMITGIRSHYRLLKRLGKPPIHARKAA